MPINDLDKAWGSTSSITLDCLQLPCSLCSGSDLQSVKNMEPRQSETRNSLLLNWWLFTVTRGWGNAITYAVGWGRGRGDDDALVPIDLSGEGIPEDISNDGCRSQTINILSSGQKSLMFRMYSLRRLDKLCTCNSCDVSCIVLITPSTEAHVIDFAMMSAETTTERERVFRRCRRLC